MDFELSADQEEIREAARSFGELEIAKTVIERDRTGHWSDALFLRMGNASLLGAPLPREHGGAGRSAFETCLALEGFGYGSGDAGLAMAWAAHTFLFGVPIARYGRAEQRRRYLGPVCTGTGVGAFAGPEPDAGDDPTRIRACAECRNGRWFLTGEKSWVINAPVASFVLVLARTAPAAGIAGISAFIVDRDARGFQAGPAIEMPGMRTAAFGTITLDACEAFQDSLLGAEGDGIAILRLVQHWERALLLAPWIGIAQVAAERVASYVRDAREVGRSVADLPSARTQLAEMTIRRELARRMIYRAALELDARMDDGRHAALARIFVADQACEVAREAAYVHGLKGLVADTHVARWHRDAMILPHVGDRNDLLRSAVAGAMLGLG